MDDHEFIDSVGGFWNPYLNASPLSFWRMTAPAHKRLNDNCRDICGFNYLVGPLDCFEGSALAVAFRRLCLASLTVSPIAFVAKGAPFVPAGFALNARNLINSSNTSILSSCASSYGPSVKASASFSAWIGFHNAPIPFHRVRQQRQMESLGLVILRVS
jgi:hypothetical protein